MDLRFRQPLDTAHPVDLIFGADEGAGDNGAAASFAITLAPPAVAFLMASVVRQALSFSIALAAPSVALSAVYDLAVTTGPQARARSGWQPGTASPRQAESAFMQAAPLRSLRSTSWGRAAPLRPATAAAWQQNARRPTPVSSAWEQGLQRPAQGGGAWQQATRRPRVLQAAWNVAAPLGHTRRSIWQERTRRPRPLFVAPWAEAASLGRDFVSAFGRATPLPLLLVAVWDESRHPLPGRSVIDPPEPPIEPPCYVPPAGGEVHLLFKDGLTGDAYLLFPSCKGAGGGPPSLVVVPIRRVYVVTNTASLRRVDGDVPIQTLTMSMSIDADSWTWGFSATLPASELASIEAAADGTPVELEVGINGGFYRVLAERLSRERVFGQSALRLSGRGRSALLDRPYAPILNFGNATPLTAQQLANQVLTLNGASIGWGVEWNLEDWLVPGGAWTHQGSYISALTSIAAAAGGYIQPHPVDDELRFLHRYPTPPWEWDLVTPDFELPSAVTVRESIEWMEAPRYNRVFVSGTGAGVLCQVTRQGTAGDLLAPMVTDALITDAVAGRQRGRAVLGYTGQIIPTSLRLPVLPETGVIQPGKFVRYTDGAVVRLGIVRSTQVEVAFPKVFQTIGVEVHAQ